MEPGVRREHLWMTHWYPKPHLELQEVDVTANRGRGGHLPTRLTQLAVQKQQHCGAPTILSCCVRDGEARNVHPRHVVSRCVWEEDTSERVEDLGSTLVLNRVLVNILWTHSEGLP
jgi:hypothetical protein